MVVWDLLDEDWIELGDWTKEGTGISEISPPGQLHQADTGVHVRRTKDIGELPTVYTAEFKLRVDAFGTIEYHFYDGEHGMQFHIKSNVIGMLNADWGWDEYSIETDNNWHIWRLVINSSGHSVKVYRDQVFVHEFTDFYNTSVLDGRVSTASHVNGEMHEDYFRVASGLHEPEPPPPALSYSDGLVCVQVAG